MKLLFFEMQEPKWWIIALGFVVIYISYSLYYEKLDKMKAKNKEEYWVIEQRFEGFQPRKITATQAKTSTIKVFKSEKEAWKAIGQIHIEPEH